MKMEERIDFDIKEAMKLKDVDRLSVLRMSKAAITNLKIQKKKEVLEEAEVLEILQKQAKQRKESIDSFQSAGRNELADKERVELKILQSYLPQQLSDEELIVIIQKTILSTGAATKAETGKLMKELMPQVKGRADGKRINELLAEILN